MRVKKQKRHRKSVRFYTACFGFRQPFKVLCDGTFVHHLVSHAIKPADNALSNILSAAVKLFTTKCVIAELKGLGTSYSESLQAAHLLAPARCDHENSTSADACIKDIIGQNNSEHFFVASQDVDLRKSLQEIPGVPVIYGLRKALFLEPPSSFQREFVKNSEEKRMHMTELEYKMLRKRKNRSADEETNDSSDENDDSEDDHNEMGIVTKPKTARKGIDVKDKVQFKRKRAKGPNPLSCKKKKSQDKPNLVPKREKTDGENSMRSRGRQRKRTRKGKKKDGSFKSHSEAWLSISPSTASQWRPPPTGWIKFNFDAAIQPNATSISVVGRDPNGMIISVCTAKEPSQSPVWDEAKAALLAMSTAINLGYKFVIFEGDAKVVIDSIVCSSSDPPWEISSIISDIRNLFPYFSVAIFSFCYRSCNELAII